MTRPQLPRIHQRTHNDHTADIFMLSPALTVLLYRGQFVNRVYDDLITGSKAYRPPISFSANPIHRLARELNIETGTQDWSAFTITTESIEQWHKLSTHTNKP